MSNRLRPAIYPSDRYDTIGQFYDAIRCGLLDLWVDLGASRVFCGHRARQISDAPFSGGGRIIAVNDPATAVAALNEIVEQVGPDCGVSPRR